MLRYNIALLPVNSSFQNLLVSLAQLYFSKTADGYLLGEKALAHVTLSQFDAPSDQTALHVYTSWSDKARQEAFIAFYENLKKTLSENEKIVFMDGVHPTNQTRMAYGWIRRGMRKELPTTSGQKRMNIIGALDLEDICLMHQEYATIDGEAILGFLKNLEVHMPTASAIHVVLDGARYHTCPVVMDYVKPHA